MTEDASNRYPQILRYVSSTPWAILPSALVRIRDFLAFKAAGGSYSAEELDEILAAARSRAASSSPPAGRALAVLPVKGVIVPHADLMTEISGGTTIDGFLAQLRDAVADPAISTIVLDIDSPGGSVELLAEAAAEIRAARDRKEVVAVANAFAASAAYYLMAQASTAIASPSSMVGSIGTIAIHQDLSKALELEGVEPTIVTFGEFKAETHPFKPLDAEGEAEMQRMVDSYGREFVADVARGRGVSASKVEHDFGRGRMLRAGDALAAGMVDGVASFDEVIDRLAAGKPALRGGARAEIAGGAIGVKVDRQGDPGPPGPGVASDAVELEVVVDAAAALLPSLTSTTPGVQIGASTAGATVELEVVVDDAAALLPSLTSTTPGVQIGAGTAGATPELRPRIVNTQARKEVSPMETIETTPRTREEIIARMEEIAARQVDLNAEYAGRLMEGDDLAEFEALDAEYHELEKTVKQIDARLRSIEQKGVEGGSRTSGDGATTARGSVYSNADTRRNLPENVFALEQYRSYAGSLDELSGLWKEGAKRVVEGLVFETDDQEKVKAHVERLLARDASPLPRDSFAHRILLTANPAYDRAFGKSILGQQLTSSEENLIRAAVSHTGLGAETPVPVTIDPTVMLTSDGQANPLRAISDVRTITGLTWRGINSEGIAVEYDAELTALVDTTPNFEAPEASVVKAQAEIQLSIEVDADWPALRSELAMMLADAKDAKEAEKFLHGTGADEPEGLIWALEDDGSSSIPTAAQNTFALEDVFTLKTALPSRFRTRASFIANDAVFDAIRLFGVDDTGPNAYWVDMNDGTPARLLGKSAYEASEMSGDVETGGEPILVYGDFSRGFVIIDRVGLNVINAGLVRNGDGRLTGAVGIYAYWRNTSKLRTANAFRMLTVADS